MLVNVLNDRFVEGYRSAIFTKETTFNTELNDLRKTISLRKSYVSVARISVRNVIENYAEHDIHC